MLCLSLHIFNNFDWKMHYYMKICNQETGYYHYNNFLVGNIMRDQRKSLKLIPWKKYCIFSLQFFIKQFTYIFLFMINVVEAFELLVFLKVILIFQTDYIENKDLNIKSFTFINLHIRLNLKLFWSNFLY